MTSTTSFKGARMAIGLAVCVAVSSLALAQGSLAEGDNNHTHDHSAHTGIYKDRADTMKSLGGAAKSTGAMFKGETEFDLAKVQAAGKLIAEKAPTIPALFPQGTNAGESEALPIIWQDFAGFEAASALLAERAGVLAAAPDPKAAGAAFGNMLKACGGCHEKFRIKKEEKSA